MVENNIEHHLDAVAMKHAHHRLEFVRLHAEGAGPRIARLGREETRLARPPKRSTPFSHCNANRAETARVVQPPRLERGTF